MSIPARTDASSASFRCMYVFVLLYETFCDVRV
jgi:hypothetical protein|eukprot:COSAG01_NODE_120_length_25409_cov_20.648572_19_plen_33_part_00